jgi:putative hemolysin
MTARHVSVAMSVWVLAILAMNCSSKAPAVQRANPASEHCVQQGGKHVREAGPTGEFGVCVFEDNRRCEEWALLRGQCPSGGIRVTGYVTQAARFCAISGGQYVVSARSGAVDEQGTCPLPGGKACDAEAHYRATCTATTNDSGG